MIIKTVILSVILYSSCMSRRETTQLRDETQTTPAQVLRFQPWFETLTPALGSGEGFEDAADLLLGGGSRVASFNLQGLAKLYSAQNETFNLMRKDFKDLEDHIGEYDKWADLYRVAQQQNASNSTIDSLKEKRKEAKKDLKKLLEDNDWISEEGKFAFYQNFIQTYPWASYDEDKKTMVGILRNQLQKIIDTQFDLTRLEEGNGLHELRREVRWFVIEARVLNGLVTFNPDDSICSIPDYLPLVTSPLAESKYGKLPRAESETNPCLIPRCLFLGNVKVVEDMGQLKDEAEQFNNIHDPEDPDLVPAELYTKATAIFDSVKQLKLWEETVKALDQCLL